MFLSFLFYFLIDPGTLYLENGRRIKKNKRMQLSDPQDSWYFVNFLNENFSFSDFSKISGEIIQSKNIINQYWANVYLKSDKYLELQNNKNFILFKVNPEDKINKINTKNTEYNQSYLIRATKDYVNPNFTEMTKFYDDYYEIKTTDPYTVASDSKVLSVSNPLEIEFENRWTHGFLQNGDQSISFDLPGARSKRTLDLDGRGTIVTIIDSGLNGNHVFFKDEKRPIPFNTIDMEHRKVVRYVSIADSVDYKIGHGTHCAGIIAGHADCDNCSINLYEGGAPAAKLQIFDITKDDSNSKEGSKFDVKVLTEAIINTSLVGSRVISCSWGVKPNALLSKAFDLISYAIDNVTMAFAAGNSGNLYTIMSPADSKNVITVGSTSNPASASVENKRKTVIVGGNRTFDVDFGCAFEALSDPKSSYEDLEIVDVSESNVNCSGKIVVVEEEIKIYEADEKGAKVILLCNRDIDIHVKFTCNALLLQMMIDKEEIIDLKRASIRIQPMNERVGIMSSLFSSKGPTVSGIAKPDLSVPGENITSADARNEEGLRRMSGTSMATPAAAACLALIEQYFVEKRHKLNTTVELKNHFFKALIIQATTSPANIIYGHGMPFLNNTLVMEPFQRGLRFFQGRMSSKQHIAFNVTVKEGKFDCTLAWNDPPIQESKSGLPLFADLDLFVKLPNGEILYGNQLNDTDKFSTVEKVRANVTDGNVEVHVSASTFLMENYTIPFSVVYNGNFDHLNTTLNPTTPSLINITERKECPKDKAGEHCQLDVKELIYGEESDLKNVEARSFVYGRFKIPNNAKKYTLIDMKVTNTTIPFVIIRATINGKETPKIGYPQTQMVSQVGKNFTLVMKNAFVAGQEYAYFSIFVDTIVNVDLKVSVQGTDRIDQFLYPTKEKVRFVIPKDIYLYLAFTLVTSITCSISYILYSRMREVNNQGGIEGHETDQVDPNP